MKFCKTFNTDNDCFNYLTDIKWENGFQCPKCNHTGWCKTKLNHIRKCNRCKHKTSATAGTLFHKVKFPIQQAFMIVFLVSSSRKGISSTELQRRLGLRQKTCYNFKRKVMASMYAQNQQSPALEGRVDVDEFFIGGPAKGKPGRSKGNKKEVVMGVEMKKKGIFRCFAKHIANGGTKELRPFFTQCISKEAKIRTDKWRGYRPLQSTYKNLWQEESKPDSNFRLFHRQVMMLKAWLRGIHHSVKQIQPYLDEFVFRYNQRADVTIFDKLVNTMMNEKPLYIKNLNLYWGS